MTRIRILTFFFSILIGSTTFALDGPQPISVYWDISHGVSDNYKPTGRYSVLVDHLDPLGFAFTEGNTPLNLVDLDSFDILVLANGSFASTFPSASEISAVDSFLDLYCQTCVNVINRCSEKG